MEVLEHAGRILLCGFVLNTESHFPCVGTDRSGDWLSTATRHSVRGLVQRISVRFWSPLPGGVTIKQKHMRCRADIGRSLIGRLSIDSALNN
jgi:hypothetical protein